MNKGLVSASLKSTHTKNNDRYALLFKGIVLLVGLVAMFAIGYSSGIAHEQKNSESDRKQLLSIEEQFGDTKPFVLFGAFKIWAAPVKGEWCYSIKARK